MTVKLTTTQRYNPELQRRSLENRQGKQEDFDNFVGKLKEYSRSEKPSTSFPFCLWKMAHFCFSGCLLRLFLFEIVAFLVIES